MLAAKPNAPETRGRQQCQVLRSSWKPRLLLTEAPESTILEGARSFADDPAAHHLYHRVGSVRAAQPARLQARVFGTQAGSDTYLATSALGVARWRVRARVFAMSSLFANLCSLSFAAEPRFPPGFFVPLALSKSVCEPGGSCGQGLQVCALGPFRSVPHGTCRPAYLCLPRIG